jgi:SCY1-like protein 1
MFSGWFAGLGGGIPNFPYTIGEPFAETASVQGVSWTMKHGTANEDSAPVTIFVLSLAPTNGADASTCESLGRNAMKRAKTLKLPGFLRCLDSIEHNKAIYIATEPCKPLAEALTPEGRAHYYDGDDEKFLEGVALGLHTVASALDSLHQNSLAHHNVSSDSVFVPPSGEWRLFGLDLVGAFDEEHSLYRRFRTGLPEHRVPPGRGLDTVSGVDAWGLGCLIYEAFSGKAPRTITQAEMRSPSCVPRKLHQTLAGLFSAEPRIRWTMSKFLKDCTLLKDSHYVNDLQALGELTLHDATDRDNYFRKLSTHVNDYPLQACKLLVLPKLNSAVQFGACSAVVLEPLLKIGARLTPDDFATHVSPSVVTLFASPEQLVRYRLLSTAHEFAALLPAPLVREKIWPYYVSGFTHKSPEIRELSVRSLVHFAPQLGEKIMAADVMRHIGQLQQDREGPIRTNSTICLGLIAAYLPESERAKLLLNGFGRMLKDPFVPSRTAAVKSFLSSVDKFTEDQMAKQIIPNVAPLMVDSDAEVRKTAIKCVTTMATKIEIYAAAMPTASATATAAGGAGAIGDPQPSPTGSDKPSTPVGPASNAGVGTAKHASGRGWFGWGSNASEASPPPADAEQRGSSSPAPVTLVSSHPTEEVHTSNSTPVPAAPTAARAAQSLHEDPALANTQGSNTSATSGNWLDEFDGEQAKPLAVKSVSKPSGGMTLRKKGIAGAKKAE